MKEKRPEDKYIIWHLRPEYEQFVHMSPEEAVAAAAALPPSENTASATAGTSSAKKRKAETAEPAEEENGHGSPAGVSNGAGGEKEPRRYKRAFGFFVKDKRAEAEAQLGSTASVSGGA